MGDIGLGNKKIIPEYNQPVGLLVKDEPERFYYAGSAHLDLPDLLAFNLQQVLPFRAQESLREIFGDVVVEKMGKGGEVHFAGKELPGYFEIKVVNLRYDYPDERAPDYRADTEIQAEFKTFAGELIWGGIFRGSGRGFPDPNIRLTEFGRSSAAAVEESYENALYEMQDSIRASAPLKAYFRDYGEERGVLPVARQS